MLSICFGTPNSMNSFYIGDYESSEQLLGHCFNTLFTKEFNGSFIYIHNGSNFDLIFLVKYLLTRSDIHITPIYKDSRFISLKIAYGKGKKEGDFLYSLTIRDSILLLKSSLSKLGSAFSVDISKDIFPYSFPNKDNLTYEGEVPKYEFFDSKKVSIKDYNEYLSNYKDSKWQLKTETLKYCVRDCISLYQVLLKFFNLIWDTFNVDATKCPTLPSLAFRIFRSKYLSNSVNIPLLSKFIYDKLSQAFFGGHVDMYIPKGPLNSSINGTDDISVDNIKNLVKEKGTAAPHYVKANYKTLKHYDINSLYPSSMYYNEFPTDIIGYFIGDITLIDDYSYLYNDKLGVYKVKVTAPSIKHPILPIRIDGTCVYPEGDWIGWYFSEELKNAEKYGYNFQIMEGFVFKSEVIFTDYIDAMNKIKTKSDKNSAAPAMYYISKILMNSLFGRLGINPFLSKNEFIPKDKFNESMKNSSYNNKVDEFVDFGTHYLTTFKPSSEQLENANNLPANVAIALAISSYSRVEMSQFKNRNDIILYYSDTDSAIVDSYLPEELVDNKQIGKFKLEAEYVLFIALGPKVYGAIDIEGNSYTKIKGFSNQVDLEILDNLLSEDNIHELKQSKWFKDIQKSDITIKVSPYQLQPTNSKRRLIYIDKILRTTENIVVKDGKKI